MTATITPEYRTELRDRLDRTLADLLATAQELSAIMAEATSLPSVRERAHQRVASMSDIDNALAEHRAYEGHPDWTGQGAARHQDDPLSPPPDDMCELCDGEGELFDSAFEIITCPECGGDGNRPTPRSMSDLDILVRSDPRTRCPSCGGQTGSYDGQGQWYDCGPCGATGIRQEVLTHL